MHRHLRRSTPALLVMLLPGLALAAEQLAVKTGLWESTTVTTTSGIQIPQLPAEALSRLPPEQRAQMENMMKQLGANGPSTRTDRSCLTEQDLKEGLFKALRESENANCKHNIVKATSRQQEVEMTCGGPVSGTGRMKVDVVDSGNVRGEMDMKSAAMTMSVKFTSRWLGASCPADTK